MAQTIDTYWLEGQKSIEKHYKVLREELKRKKENGASDEELEDYSNRYFMYVANDFSRFIPRYNRLSDKERYDEISRIRKQCDRAYDILSSIKGGDKLLSVTPIYGFIFTADKIIELADKDPDVDKALSISVTTGNIYYTALNDDHKDLINIQNGLVNTIKTVERYPDSIILVRNAPSQAIFKHGKIDRGHYRDKYLKEELLLFSKDVDGIIAWKASDGDDLYEFDLVILEAIISLTAKTFEEIKNSGNKNTYVALDMDQVYRLVHHQTIQKKIQLSAKYKNNRTESEIYKRIESLFTHKASIQSKKYSIEGQLLDGELLITQAGKVYIILKEEPVLYRHALKHKMFNRIDIDKIRLKKDVYEEIPFKYTYYKICIYRYLIQRLIEIYGSIFIDDKHCVPKKSYPEMALVDKLYEVCGFSEYPRSKKQTIQAAITDVLKSMVINNMITTFDFVQGTNEIRIRRQSDNDKRK